MAVTAIKMGSSLKMKFSLGKDENGKEQFKRKSFANVKSDATDQNVFDVA